MCAKLTNTDITDDEFEDELKPGTELLHGQYVIEQFLNNGGFGITYLAKDSLNRLVVIKECFPEAICRRANSTVRVRSRNQAVAFRTIVDLFIEEARNLARLSHPNIVGIHQVFEDNDTAYMAMDFVEGRDLLEIADSSKSFNPEALEGIVVKLLDAIEFIHHEGILHRDIAPDNILLRNDSEPVLIDFGAARETVTRATRFLGSMRTVKDGYSPQEFYVTDSEQYPSSDLYSLAASLYHVMTKEVPISAQERLSAIAGGDADPYVSIKGQVSGYSEPFLQAIDQALDVFPKNRIQSAAEWRALITQTKATLDTRGSVSRPMLAVDNGNVLDQFEETSGFSTVHGRKKPEKQMPPRRATHNLGKKNNPDSVFLEDTDLSALAGSGKSASKGLYVGVAAAAVLVLVGAGAFLMTGSGSEPAAPDQVAAVEAPVEATPPKTIAAPVDVEAETPDTQIAASDPEVTAPEGGSPLVPATQNRVPEFSFEMPGNNVPAAPTESVSSKPAISPNDVAPIATAPIRTERTSRVNRTIESETPQQPATLETEGTIVSGQQTTDVQDISSLISGAAVQFPVVADPDDPAVVVSAEGPIAEHLKSGYRVLSINGFPISSLNEFQRVVGATSDYSVGDAVKVTFGIEDPVAGETFVRSVNLAAVEETLLLNGVRFQTTRDGDKWTTTVASGTGDGEADLQAGDRIVALMPDNEMIDTQDGLSKLLKREISKGNSQFNFAVSRDGAMWLATMQYAVDAGN